MNNTQQFDIELLKAIRELGATDITLPSGLRAVFPNSVPKQVDVQAKVAKARKEIDPEADRKAFYASVLGVQHE